MSLALLIPLSLAMGFMGLIAFFWALRHQQFEDLEGAAWRVLMTVDSDGPGNTTPAGGGGQIGIEDGRFVVDAALIAQAFGIPADLTRKLMRDGIITSRSERGEGSDAGRHRLTFYYRGRACRFVVDDSGRILKRLRFDTPARRPETGR